MTEPIKPRMDFSDTPQSSEEMRLKPGKIFAEQQASLFSIPETEVSGQETQKSVTDLENTLLKPRRHLQHRLFIAGLCLFAVVLIAQSVRWLILSLQQQNWIALTCATAVGFIILAAIAGIITEWRRLSLLRRRIKTREEASELLLSPAGGNSRKFCETLVRESGMSQQHPAFQHWQAALHETHSGSEVIILYAKIVQPVFDARARNIINRYAAESALMIAVSPLALVDMIFIAWRNIRLINHIAALYGIELGYFSRIYLLRMVLLNIAFAGISELVRESSMNWLSQDLTARLSARIAQGIGVGLLTARLGIKAMELCRQLPWMSDDKPGLGDLRRQLTEQLKDMLKK